ncbi:hypothetical protein AGMMS49992_18270 [Clostridia bacterium]|nr:hypothetical protein AGMMS49992_18270 [Clostridia bacterium]
MNNNLISLLSRIISNIKGQEYAIDQNIPLSLLLHISIKRLFMLIRGCIRKPLFGSIVGIPFIGKGCKFIGCKLITCGAGMTIEDGCYINATSRHGIKVGKNFSLGRNSIIECTGVIRELGESLTVCDNVGISANAFISVRAPISIGNNTICGPGVKLFAENHSFNNINIPIYQQPSIRKGVNIGSDCWIGGNTTILDGVTIGEGCVVSAGAVVNHDIPPYAIAVGVPARVIRYRLVDKENV